MTAGPIPDLVHRDFSAETPLIDAAIHMAARNCDLPPHAIFHSDRGSNYTSAQFGRTLESLDRFIARTRDRWIGRPRAPARWPGMDLRAGQLLMLVKSLV